jgi:site-specific recombinase XerD
MTGALGKRSNGYARRMLHRGVAERIHMIEDAYVNWFLVEEAGKLTVVDSGHPSSWKSLQNALSGLGHSSGDIEALVHAHAVEMAREGVPLIVIQRQLGHSNLGITSVYLQGIDSGEIIETVHARRAPMIPVSASLRL